MGTSWISRGGGGWSGKGGGGGGVWTPLPTMVTSKDENYVEALMLTSKLNRASLGISH